MSGNQEIENAFIILEHEDRHGRQFVYGYKSLDEAKKARKQLNDSQWEYRDIYRVSLDGLESEVMSWADDEEVL